MVEKPLIIYNPTAGQGAAAHHLDQVKSLLNESEIDHDLVITQGQSHATNLARDAAKDGRRLVVAAGGDGTVNEVVNGLMAARSLDFQLPALGVLPVGRGNDFAYGVGIPLDIAPAVETLITGSRRKIDLGYFKGGDYPDGRYFGNGIGLGFDTVVGFEAAKIKWLKGAGSYLAALVKTIFLYAKAPVYEIDLDGEILRQPFLLVSIMNGRRMGGSFYMAPDGDPSDAVFDLCLAGQVPQVRILPLAIKFFSGTQAQSAAIRMAKGRHISVKAIVGTIPAHADGETICTAGNELRIEIIPQALDVLTHVNGASA